MSNQFLQPIEIFIEEELTKYPLYRTAPLIPGITPLTFLDYGATPNEIAQNELMKEYYVKSFHNTLKQIVQDEILIQSQEHFQKIVGKALDFENLFEAEKSLRQAIMPVDLMEEVLFLQEIPKIIKNLKTEDEEIFSLPNLYNQAQKTIAVKNYQARMFNIVLNKDEKKKQEEINKLAATYIILEKTMPDIFDEVKKLLSKIEKKEHANTGLRQVATEIVVLSTTISKETQEQIRSIDKNVYYQMEKEGLFKKNSPPNSLSDKRATWGFGEMGVISPAPTFSKPKNI